jgi:hypothetical protein
MPDSREFDVKSLKDLRIPYDVVTKELSDAAPRLVAGSQNVYITPGGKIALAPGMNQTPGTANLTSFSQTMRPDRLIVYETIEVPAKIYLVGSFFNSGAGTWDCQWLRLDAGSPAWTSVGSLRNANASTRPHEISVNRGLCFIKSFPSAVNDKYGAVILDGSIPNPGSNTIPSVYPWGTIPAAIAGSAAAMTASSGWTASTFAFSVLFGWSYVWCAKDLLNNYGCPSPTVTVNVSGTGFSTTGAFSSKCPAMTIVPTGYNTTSYPKLGIFRTTDGGGTFWFVEDITNTGASQTYTDKNGLDAGVHPQPFADSQLNTATAAPGTVINFPPPPTGGKPGEVDGTSQVDPSSPVAFFARRGWYGIGNRLYFSGQEEILNGVPEECWPNANGIGPANQYICQGQIRQIAAAKSALWITTSNEILYETGTDRSNFLLNCASSDIAGLASNPLAMTAFRDMAFFISQDFQVYALMVGYTPINISAMTLGSSLRTAYLACTTPSIQMEAYNRDGMTWLIIAVIDSTTPANNRQFVYNLSNAQMERTFSTLMSQGYWFAPWTKQLMIMAYGRLRDGDPSTYLIAFIWNGTNYQLAVLDPAVFTDIGTAFNPTVLLNLFGVPFGDHVNEIMAPALQPMVAYLQMERTKFTSDTEPSVSYRLEDFSGALTAVTGIAPPFVPQRTSFNVWWYSVMQTAKRIQMQITKSAVNEAFEIQNLGIVFLPTAGA